MWEFGPLQVKKPHSDKTTYQDLAICQTVLS